MKMSEAMVPAPPYTKAATGRFCIHWPIPGKIAAEYNSGFREGLEDPPRFGEE